MFLNLYTKNTYANVKIVSVKLKSASLRFCSLILSLLLVSASSLAAQTSDLIAPEDASGFNAKSLVKGHSYMAVTANHYASQTAQQVLAKGGSAIDAAIAAQLVLGLVEPQSSGLGGGAFILHYEAKTKKLTSFDARETAPLAITSTHFLDTNGQPIGFYDAVVSARSVATPATVMWMSELHKKWGKLAWAELFQPAIALAKTGFIVSPRLAMLIANDQQHLQRDASSAAYFFTADGKPLQAGVLLKNPAYAKTLTLLAKKGAAAFYQGALAQQIVNKVQQDPQPGVLTLTDLANYKVIEREPVCFPYRGYHVCGMGAPSSGAYTMGIILGLLEGFDLNKLGADSPSSWRLIADASRLAFSDRNLYIADTDFNPLPLNQLLAPDYLAKRRHLLGDVNSPALKHVSAGHPFKSNEQAQLSVDASLELPSTSHLSIVDPQGNIISMTSTIENVFGSRLMVAGFLLNNELTDFSFIANKNGKAIANRIEPGKRPRSSMTPTIIFDSKIQPYLVLGSPGGSRIINYVTQTIINHIDWLMPIDKAIAMPHRVNQYGPYLLEEETNASEMKNSLEKQGYPVQIKPLNSGLNVIQFKNGLLYGATDPRREGLALSVGK